MKTAFRRFLQNFCAISILLYVFCFPVSGVLVEFTVNTVINAGDTTYDGMDIVVNGCTLSVDGQHTFSGMTLQNGATLTHPACSAATVSSIDLTISGTLSVSAGSVIDVNGRGYLPRYTIGNITNGGAAAYCGGSHGGYGSGAGRNDVYDDYALPENPGAGGGQGSGGGVVKLTAGTMQLDGGISANALAVGYPNYGGGAGGSIQLHAQNLSGTGTISANGGDGYWGGGGSGGRIAIYYTNASGFNLTNNISAHAAGGSGLGAVGTIYLERLGGSPRLLIDSHGTGVGEYTPLGVAGDTEVGVHTLEIAGAGVVAQPHHQLALNTTVMTLRSGAVLRHAACTETEEYSLDLAVAGTLSVASGSMIDASGRGYLPRYTVGNITNGGAAVYCGGSHGGYGAGAGRNDVYDDYTEPEYPGAGGGQGRGGGVIKLTAGTVELDGGITVDAPAVGYPNYGGGAGGSIQMDVQTLRGTGTISANGGDGYWGGGGGGGRIALYYTVASDFDLASNITAHAAGGSGGYGSIGTIYLEQQGESPRLLIDSHGTSAGVYTPLGLAADTGFSVHTMEIAGNGVVIQPHHQLPVSVTSMTLRSGAVMRHAACTETEEYSLDLSVAETLSIAADSAIDASDRGYLPRYTKGNTTNDGAAAYCGGSHGGYGAGAGRNDVYDDYTLPENPGAGGGQGRGGGVVTLTAETLDLDGRITVSAPAVGYPNYGGGAGGSIHMNVQTLMGAGTISANGGDGYWGGGGSGGRIAIYYTDASGFDLASNITAHAAGGSGGYSSAGTIYLEQQGGSPLLLIDSHGTPVGVYTPLGLANDTEFSAHTLDIAGSGVVVQPHHQLPLSVTTMTLRSGAAVRHAACTDAQEFSLDLSIAGTLSVAAGCSLDATGRGYLAGRTVGNTTAGGPGAYAGGSHGGRGAGDSSRTYGDYRYPVYPGGGGYQGPGGGVIHITASAFQLDGSISVNGPAVGYPNYGGGAGGSVVINAGTFSGAGTISADGGDGYWGGGGGGGRVAVYAWDNNVFTGGVSVTGAGGSAAGLSGSIYYATAPWFTFDKKFSGVAHGIQSISWQSLGINPGDVLLDIYIIRNGKEYLLAANINGSTFNWDTFSWPDGVYEIRLVFRSAKTGEILAEQREPITINNTLIWHSGTISTDEVWRAGTVHAVDGELVIDGAQLSVVTGAVVKFLRNASISVGDGSGLVLSGSAAAPVYLTSILDDSVGGDSNLDGDASEPEPGDWSGILLNITATLTENEYVYYRYMKTGHSGELTQSQVWPAKVLHSIIGNVTVPDGVTLTIAAGAIVKFEEDTQIIVNNGGRIIVNGTVAQPVILTSYRDDTAGGDSNGDGSLTTPAAGDWHWILLNGGQGIFNQCELRYGGGPALGGWGPPGGPGKATIKTYGAANLVVSNTVVRDSYYDGILSWGGPVTIVNSIFTGIDRAICAHPGSLVTVVNCTLDDNRVGLLLHGGILRANNSIIYGSYTAGLLHDYGADDVILSYCAFWNPQASAGNYSGTADQSGLRGNSITNPVFRGTGAGSYELGYQSPCIDAADTLIAPPRDSKGNPRVNNPRITPTGIPNASNIYADIGAFEFVEDAESPIDLVAINIQGDTVVTAGMEAAVSWQVANIGSSAVSGSWHDAVYLAPVTAGKWDVPVLAAQVLSTGKSAPGQPLTRSAVVRVPGGTEGTWAWRIKVNARGEIFEGRNSYNNSGTAIMSSQLHVPEFQEGVTVTNSFAAIGAAAWYKIELASTQSVLVSLDSSAASGRCQLSAGYDAMPTVTNYDIRSAALNSPDARLTVSARGQQRTAYLRLMPEKLDGALGYRLKAEPSVFALESIGIDTAGNSGAVSIPLRGSAFGSGMSVTLRPAAGVDIVAHTVAIADATLAQAVFNLAGATPGVYSVIAGLAGQTAQLPAALTIITGTGGRLETSVLVPETVRDGRPFTGYLEYRNSGDADLPAPLLTVQGSSSGIKVWDQNATSGTLSGVSWLGVAQDSPLPSILGPGSRYTIPFRATATGVSRADFQVYILDTNDTTIMNYTALGEVVAGPTPHPLWSNAWNRFKAEAGPLRGGYVAALGRAVDRARLFGLTLMNERDILSFLVREGYEAVQQASVGGIVYLTSSNQPLPEVLVRITAEGGVTGASNEVFQTATWYDGTFGIRDVTPGTYTLSVEGYLPDPFSTITLSDPVGAPIRDLVIIVTTKTAIVHGYVREGSDGPGVSGARVIAEAFDTLAVFPATTDSEGYYRIPDLPPGNYTLSAAADGWKPLDPVTITLSAGQILQRSFGFTVGGMVNGVVYSPGSVPVGHAKVYINAADPPDAPGAWRGAETEADSSGAFVFTGLQPGRYILYAAADTYGASLPVEANIPFDLEAQSTSLWLSVAGRITGSVLEAGSLNPLAGVFVGSDAYPPIGSPVYSGADGTFVLDGLAAGIYVITAVTNGYMLEDATVTNTGMATPPVTLLMEPAGSVVGVVTRDGVPAAQAMVTLRAPGGQFRDLSTGADGSYGIRNLPTGTYWIAASEPDGPLCDWHTFTVTPALPDFTIDLNLSAASIAGTLYAIDGTTPVYNALVTLARGNDTITSTRSDIQGRYKFHVYQAGEYTVYADTYGTLFTPHTGIVVAGIETLSGYNFIAPANRLEISVSAAGSPVAKALVYAQMTADVTSNTMALIGASASNGVCVFSHVPAGEYAITVLVASKEYTTMLVTAGVGTTRHDVDLAAGRIVRGTVRNGSYGLPNTRVSLSDARGELLITRTKYDGTFEFTSVPTGIFSLIALPLDTCGPVITNGIDMRTDAVKEIIVQAPPLSVTAIAGTVTTTTGNAVPDALVRLETADGVELSSALADSDGTYACKDCPAGSFTLVAWRDGHRPVRRAVVSQTGVSLNNIDLALAPPCAAPANPEGGTAVNGNAVLGIGTALTDWLSGGSYLQPPKTLIGQLKALPNYKTIWIAAKASGKSTCAGAESAMWRCQSMETHLLLQELDWDQAYSAVRDINYANVMLVLSRGALVTAKGLKLAANFAKFTGYNPDSIRFECPELNVFLDINETLISESITIINNNISLMRSKLLKGDFKDVGGYLNVIRNAIFAIEKIGGTKIPKIKLLYELVSLGKSICDYLDDLKEFESDAVRGFMIYDEAGRQWFEYHHRYLEAYASLRAAVADCKGSRKPPPPPKPPYPPGRRGGGGGSDTTGSIDPNDKYTTGVGINHYIRSDATIYYSITFENVPTAAAPAQVVLVVDQLDQYLDLSSVELVDLGFNNVETFVPAGQQQFAGSAVVATDPNPVRITAGLNPDTGQITWEMASMDPVTGELPEDPFAGFLPPNNTNAHDGEGFVQFRVNPKPGLPSGTVISNMARITFDVNQPIDTPWVINIIDSAAPVSSVSALPAQEYSQAFTVSWSGTDAESGIADFDVYCAIDGGAYTCWIEAATNHSAQYQGSYGHTYAFYSIARDAVGNIELPPAVADTTTQVTLLAPAGVSATDGLYADSIGVSWNTVPSATMYAVYRSISAQFAGEALLGTTTASEYQDATVVPGTTYYYRVGARVSAYESVRSVSDSGFALMTAAWTGEWKYKDAKTTDVLIGKKLPYDLKGYFLDKWQIGMASIVDGKITNFYGPHMMEGKGKKLSKWQYKAKKDASIVFISKDKPDKNKLVYKLWHQMPETIVIYLVPPGVNITTRNQMTIDNLRFILVPVDPAQSNGWQELTPTIINEEQ